MSFEPLALVSAGANALALGSKTTNAFFIGMG